MRHKQKLESGLIFKINYRKWALFKNDYKYGIKQAKGDEERWKTPQENMEVIGIMVFVDPAPNPLQSPVRKIMKVINKLKDKSKK